MVMSPAGPEPENDCVGEGQQQLQTTPILSSERMLHKTITASVQFEKNTNRGSHGAWRQGDLIGDKPPVVK
jgi:hypothetical protein